MMTDTIMVSLVMAVVAILGFSFTISRARTADNDRISALIESNRRESAAQIESVRKEMIAVIERVEAVSDKARHDLANSTASAQAGLTARMVTLERESVRRDEIASSQARLEQKIDRQGEALTRLAVLESTIGTLAGQVKQVLDLANRANSSHPNRGA